MNLLKVLTVVILTVTSLLVFNFTMLSALLCGVDEPQWVKVCGLIFAVLCTYLVGKEKGVSVFFRIIYLSLNVIIVVLYLVMLAGQFLFVCGG